MHIQIQYVCFYTHTNTVKQTPQTAEATSHKLSKHVCECMFVRCEANQTYRPCEITVMLGVTAGY